MNTNGTPPDDDLDKAYQQASAQSSGLPSGATRAAILAEARAAALRRTPAANDSRYVWRAVAGMAMLGVAVLIWRQTDTRLPTSTPMLPSAPVLEPAEQRAADVAPPEPAAAPPTVAPSIESAAQSIDREFRSQDVARADAAAPIQSAERPEVANVAGAADSAEASAASAAAEAADAAGAAAIAAPPPETVRAAPAPSASASASGAESARRRESLARSASQDASPEARLENTDATNLVRRYFPEHFESDNPPVQLWVVIDASGRVLESGSRASFVDWAQLTAPRTRGASSRSATRAAGRSRSAWRSAADQVGAVEGQADASIVSR